MYFTPCSCRSSHTVPRFIKLIPWVSVRSRQVARESKTFHNMNLHIRIWAPVSECECSVLPLIFKPLLAMAEGGGRPEEEGEREKERDGVMWRSKCRLWRDKDREWERAAKQTKPKRESIKKNNDQQPSSHRVRFLLFFFSITHTHAPL